MISDTKFTQYVEGGQEAVEALMARLHADSRHDNIVVLFSAELRFKRFPDWSMHYLGNDARGYADEERLAKALLLEENTSVLAAALL